MEKLEFTSKTIYMTVSQADELGEKTKKASQRSGLKVRKIQSQIIQFIIDSNFLEMIK